MVFLLVCGCGPRRPLEMAPDVGIEKLLQSPIPRLAALSELHGQVIVLDFWATWCGICTEKRPHMNKLVETFKDKPVRFIAVTDEDAAAVEDHLRDHPIKAWIGLDPSRRAFQAFGVRGVPEAFVIDPYGRVALKIHPSWLYESDIAKALKAQPPAEPPIDGKPSEKL